MTSFARPRAVWDRKCIHQRSFTEFQYTIAGSVCHTIITRISLLGSGYSFVMSCEKQLGEKFGLFEIWWMEMQPCIMKSKIVSTAVVGLEPWVSGWLNELLGSKDDTARPQGLSRYRDKPWNSVTFFCLHKNIKFCPDKMRSLRINGTNAHDIQVQNNVDIYKQKINIKPK